MARAATGPTTTPAIQAFPEERLTGSEEVLDVEGLVDAVEVANSLYIVFAGHEVPQK